MHATALDVFEASGYAAQIDAVFARAMELIPGSFPDHEEAALTFANAIVRRWMMHRLQVIADSFGDEVSVDGEEYRRHQPGEGTYHSLVGDLAISRHTYRRVGVHNGPIIVPVELAAGWSKARRAGSR